MGSAKIGVNHKSTIPWGSLIRLILHTLFYRESCAALMASHLRVFGNTAAAAQEDHQENRDQNCTHPCFHELIFLLKHPKNPKISTPRSGLRPEDMAPEEKLAIP
jgi:hypothetical protein